MRRLCERCPACAGKGWVKATATIAYAVLRRIRREATVNAPLQRIAARVHPDVAAFLTREERAALQGLQDELRLELALHPSSELARDQYEVTAVARRS